MVILEFNDIHVLKNVILPIFSKNDCNFTILQSKKLKDFLDWSIIVNIYYLGYHLLPEGISLINEIKNNWNNFRLSTNKSRLEKENTNTLFSNFNQTEVEIKNKLTSLFLIPAPYEIKNGVRYLKDTNKLVSEKVKIISIDKFNKKSIYSSITECSKALQIDRSKIKNCILTGKTYNNYNFILFY